MKEHLCSLIAFISLVACGSAPPDGTSDEVGQQQQALTATLAAHYTGTVIALGGQGGDAYQICFDAQKSDYNDCMNMFGECGAEAREQCNTIFNYNIWVNCVLDPGAAVEPLVLSELPCDGD
jgi:hypothetical protein